MAREKSVHFVNVNIMIGWCAKAFCFCALALSLPLSCFALRINNPKFDIQLDKGKSYSGSITVENNSDKDARIRVYAEDFIYVPPFDGSKEFSHLGTTNFSLSSWLVLPPTEFTLLPYANQTVNFILRPQESVTKVHCGVIFFETTIGKTTNEQGQGIDILGRVGSLIFVEPQELRKIGEFSEITADHNSLTGNFLNNGNTFLHVQGTYYIIDAAEIVKDRGKITELYLLPQDKARVAIKLPQNLSEGKFTLVITFDLEGETAVVKEIDLQVSANGEVNILATRD
jgi:hypothetical protein